MIALQFYVGLCHLSAWVSPGCVSVPFLLNLPPPSHPVPLFSVASSWFVLPVFWILWEGNLKYVLFCVSVLFFFFAVHYFFEIHLVLCVTCNVYHVMLVNIPPFIHSVVDGHLGCFQLRFVTGGTALTVLCSACMWIYRGIGWNGALGPLGVSAQVQLQ